MSVDRCTWVKCRRYRFYDSFSFGEMTYVINDAGYLEALDFIKAPQKSSEQTDQVPLNVLKTQSQLIVQLRAYEKGEFIHFDLPLSPTGTSFQRKVWGKLLMIPYGESKTYGEIAKDIAQEDGKKTFSAQAIGQAVGKNPIAIIIPCHRVIGKNGYLTGYAGGLDKKMILLDIEGVAYEV